MFNKFKSGARKVCSKIKSAFTATESKVMCKAHEVLDGTVAEAYVDTGVKILIAVVVGALVLTTLYALFNDTVLPTASAELESLFYYEG